MYVLEGVVIDGDNPDHVSWLLQQAEQRAAQYNITGVTYRLTQGVVKRIIPAVASSNAVIAGRLLRQITWHDGSHDLFSCLCYRSIQDGN